MFDLGGVIMDIRRENAVEALTKLGMEDADRLLGNYGQHGIFLKLEEGTVSVDEFHDEVRKFFPEGRQDITDKQIDDAFMKFLIGIPVHRLRTLERLHKSYGIYLLSNTNIIMWNGEIKKAFEEDGHDINYYFDGIVTSFEAHYNKPDDGIFEYAIKTLGIDPRETLFLDDSTKNLEASEKFGFQTLHVSTDSEFENLLKCRL